MSPDSQDRIAFADIMTNPYLLVFLYFFVSLSLIGPNFETLILGGCQDYNFLHAYANYTDFEYWKTDTAGSFGQDRFFLIRSMSFWGPVAVHRLLGIPLAWLFCLIFFLRAPIILLLFTFVARNAGASNRSTSLVLTLMMAGDFFIFEKSPGNYPLSFFTNYYSTDFFIPALLGVHFFLRRRHVCLGICLLAAILLHPGQGALFGLFMVTIAGLQSHSVRHTLAVSLPFVIGILAVHILIGYGKGDFLTIPHEDWWRVFEYNGHLNFPFLYRFEFVERLIIFIFLYAAAVVNTAPSRIRQMLIYGGLFYLLLIVAFFLAHALELQIVMTLGTLRFSNTLLFIVFLQMALFSPSKQRWRMLLVCALLLYCIPWPIPRLVKVLLSLWALVAFEIWRRGNHKFVYALIVLLTFFQLVTTLHTRLRTNTALQDVACFAKENFSGGATILLWGTAPRAHMLRTVTGYRVIEPSRRGLSIYDAAQSIYDDELNKARCAGFDGNVKDLFTHGRKEECTERLTRDILERFQDAYEIDYVLVDNETTVEDSTELYRNDVLSVYRVESASAETTDLGTLPPSTD